MLEPKTEAPAFTLGNQDGEPVSLADHRGRWVLVWWYPKAATPGSTLQGQGLRDQAPRFDEAGCDILGVSFDTPKDNLAFKQANEFPFPLLSDTDKSVGTTYEVLRNPGDKFADYPRRISYLIDPDGTIVKSYEVSDPGGHAAAVLADLAAAQR